MSRLLSNVLLLLACAAVFIIFLKEPGINGYYTAMYGDMVYGKAHRPFVTRALLPAVVRATTAAVPANWRAEAAAFAATNGNAQQVVKRLGWEPELATEYIAGCAYMLLALLGFTVVLRKLAAHLFTISNRQQDLIAGGALLSLPALFGTYSHIYDFPTLLLFTLGLLLLAKKAFTPYLLLFTIACFNKETTLLLLLLSVLLFYKTTALSEYEFKKFIAVQAILYLLIRGSIGFYYQGNAGSSFELHLRHNIGLLHSYSFGAVLTVIAFCVLLFFRWKGRHPFLRKAWWLALPLIATGTLFGRFDEPRAFLELLPIAVLSAAEGLLLLLGIPMRHGGTTAGGLK